MMISRIHSFFRILTICSSFILGLLSTSSPKNLDAIYEPTQSDLPEILDKTANYCERLRSIVIHFICVEEVGEKIFHPYAAREIRNTYQNWRTEENRYHYDYQLFQRDEIVENRTLTKFNGKEQQLRDALLETKRFEYKNIVLGPIGLFSRKSQLHYGYKIEDTGRLWGKDIVIVTAEPKSVTESESLFGKAWIDEDNGSILKIEWEQASIENYQDMVEFAESLRADPRLKFYTEYKFEKHGIRFPSLYTMKEHYMTDISVQMGFRIVEKKNLLEKSELHVKYKDYQFFIVETEVKY